MTTKPTTETPLVRINTETFVNTGLVWFLNQLLHAFGFALAYHQDSATGTYSDFYVCRTIFRGHVEGIGDKGYERVARYLKDHAAELYTEGAYGVDEPLEGEGEDGDTTLREDFAAVYANEAVDLPALKN